MFQIKSFLIIFDEPNPIINCLSDNIFVSDETGNVVLNYCQKKTPNNILFIQHVSRNLFVKFIYGGLNDGLMSISFKWIITNAPPNNPAQPPTYAPQVSFFNNPPTVSFFNNPPIVSFVTVAPTVSFFINPNQSKMQLNFEIKFFLDS